MTFNVIRKADSGWVASPDLKLPFSVYTTRDNAEKEIKLLYGNKVELIHVNSTLSLVRFSSAIKGGVGDDLPLSQIPKDEIEIGMSIEAEHSPDPEIQLDIVKDHEAESLELGGKAEYYKYLQKMEKEMASSNK